MSSGVAVPTVAPEPTGLSTSIAYQPALDGVRAVSVAMVLLFHGGVSWMTGGYLGVSVFFTLSGYLITTLLLREADARGRVGIGAFYARRARRLLPASLLVIAGIAVGTRFGLFEGLAHLERDLLGALFQVANWVQLLGGESYADLLTGSAGLRSPLDHYWSLAIEEQFYWVWPVAIGLLSRRGAAARLRALLVAAGAAAVLAPLIAWVWGTDAAYWATPARASEILFGAALAALLHGGRLARVPGWLAPGCLAALVALAVVLPASGGLAYHGGLPLVAALSTGLVLGLQRPGPVRSVLSGPPLVALGRISYGVYLYHWPIYVVLDEHGTGWYGTQLLTLRIVATLAVATVSYLVVERPVRAARWRPSRTGRLAGVAVAAAGIVVVTLTAPAPASDFGPDETAAAAVGIPPLAPGERLPALTFDDGVPSRPVRILLVGDSTAMALGAGMVEWARDGVDVARVTVDGSLGCGFLRSGSNPDLDRYRRNCNLMFSRLSDDIVALQPDVVALLTWAADIAPRSWAGGPPLTPVDPEYRRHLEADYRAITDLVLDSSPAEVVWLRPPVANPLWMGEIERTDHPERRVALDEVTAAVAAARPDRVTIVDLQAYLEETGLNRVEDVRPDGVHLSLEGATDLTSDWLGPLLIDLAADLQSPP